MDIKNLTKEELKKYCRKNKIKGYSKKKKNEIIELIFFNILTFFNIF